MNTENFVSTDATIGCGFFIGFLIRYALKKLVKLVAVAVGLFFAGIAYLQYEEVVNVNWTKLQAASQNTVSTIANATTQIPGFVSDHHTAALVMANLGIPLTGSLSMGIAIGFMKG
jgi:uncharacterized membrane protein (Fun14 family)